MPPALTLSMVPSMGSGSAERRDQTVRRTGMRVARRGVVMMAARMTCAAAVMMVVSVG